MRSPAKPLQGPVDLAAAARTSQGGPPPTDWSPFEQAMRNPDHTPPLGPGNRAGNGPPESNLPVARREAAPSCLNTRQALTPTPAGGSRRQVGRLGGSQQGDAPAQRWQWAAMAVGSGVSAPYLRNCTIAYSVNPPGTRAQDCPPALRPTSGQLWVCMVLLMLCSAGSGGWGGGSEET